MSYRLINANNISFNSDGFITAENIEKMPCIYADLPNGMDGKHYIFEQEPKTGHWIDNPVRKNLCNCSECNGLNNVYSAFCPNCGAKMVEQEGEEI